MGSAQPKQFLELGGKPILCRTIERFQSYNPELRMIVVMNPNYLEFCEELFDRYLDCEPPLLVEGGADRFHSVRNGLDAIKETMGIVGIHDAVRPFVSQDTIEACYETARARGNAIPVVRVFESLRQVNGDGSKVIDREEFRIVQTPQCFELSMIKDAYAQGEGNFTDDASVVEACNIPINLVEGNRENIKITTPADLKIAEGLVTS